jgi:Putative NADH-flavin reductase
MSEKNTQNPYKILVVGGTGRVGQEIIRSALKKGYHVRAITRNLQKAIKFEEGEVEWQQCNATEKECMTKATEGRDAVLSAIGSDKPREPTTVFSDSLKVMLEVMKENNVNRLLTVSCDWENPSNGWVFRNIVKKMLKHVQADMTRMEEILSNRPKDQLQWTVVRAFHLIKKPYTGQYRVGPSNLQPPFKANTNTGDLGDFMVNEARDKNWVNTFVTIGL